MYVLLEFELYLLAIFNIVLIYLPGRNDLVVANILQHFLHDWQHLLIHSALGPKEGLIRHNILLVALKERFNLHNE